MTTHADLVAAIERATGLNAGTLLAQLADHGLTVMVLDETETLRAKVARVEAACDDMEHTAEFLAYSGDTHDAAMGGAVDATLARVRAELQGPR